MAALGEPISNMGTQRITITLYERDKAWLESFSKARGISMAEAIRRGIAQLMSLGDVGSKTLS